MVNIISIDWAKIEEKPNKKIAVEGKLLLEKRSKIKSLEQDLKREQENLRRTTDELKITKEKLAGREKSLTEITERKSTARKSLSHIKEEKLHADIEIAKLQSTNTSLEEKLTEAVSEAKMLNIDFKDLEEMLSILFKEEE